MAEITLADLVAWEPRLRPLDPAGPPEWGERDISWIVTARTSAPMLPSIRGGELVLLPGRAINDSGVALPVLLRELVSHGAGGVVLDRAPSQAAPLPVLIADAIPPDFESDLNRLLTERRGELYRAGTDLGRLLTNATSAGADLALVLSTAVDFLNVPAAVVDRRGAVLASSADQVVTEIRPGATAETGHGWHGDRLNVRLTGGETLWLGPAPKAKRALVRLAAERIAVAAEAAIQRAAEARPRGPARATALTALLTGTASDAVRAATQLGLPPGGLYRVALASSDIDPQTLQRQLGPQGVLHEAAPIDRATAVVIELRPDAIHALNSPAASRHGAGRRRDGAIREHIPLARGWIALSSVANGAVDLPGAANEARFVAGLLTSELIPAGVARFEALGDLGPYRLLYRFWGTSELDAFARDALGELPARDRRGTLRKTLLAYLSTGGSHVDAAARLEIHRNTLAYRLRQIAALSGREPSDPSTWLVFHLALLASSLPPAPSRALITEHAA
jgi:hypothetical protein